MFPHIINLEVNGNGFCSIRNETQKNIINLLMKSKGLTARQVARRLHRKYKTIYEELQKMKNCQQIRKDKNKIYFTNPKFGDYLIHSGLEIIGLENHATAGLLRKRQSHIRKKVNVLKRITELLERHIKEILGVSG